MDDFISFYSGYRSKFYFFQTLLCLGVLKDCQIWKKCKRVLRSHKAICQDEVQRVLFQREHRRAWTEQEDEQLRKAVAAITSNGRPRWKQISAHLNAKLMLEFPRNPKQCRERWANVLKSMQTQATPWTIQDDVSLIRACKKHGHRWARLAKEFDGRINDNRLKNHFYCNVRKVVRHVNNLLKKAKKQQQRRMKEGIQGSTEDEEMLLAVSKIRNFETKYFSKVFSLLDSKQEFKFEARENMEVDGLRMLNERILDLIEDYITDQHSFSEKDIFQVILQVMQINKCVKTKYVREAKMSINTREQIDRLNEERKKRDKQIDKMVKQELNNKIIPDKKTKKEVINDVLKSNPKYRRLIRHRLKEKPKCQTTRASDNEPQQEQIKMDEPKNQMQPEVKISHEDFVREGSQDVFGKTGVQPFESSFLNNIPVAKVDKEEKGRGFMFPENLQLQALCEGQKELLGIEKPSLFMFDLPCKASGIFNEEILNRPKAGLFASVSYENQDKRSDCSEIMRSSLYDLIEDYHPNHIGAFQPMIRQGERPFNQLDGDVLNLERSQPFSMSMLGFNLMESQPLFNHDLMLNSQDIKKLDAKFGSNQMAQSCSFSHTKKKETTTSNDHQV